MTLSPREREVEAWPKLLAIATGRVAECGDCGIQWVVDHGLTMEDVEVLRQLPAFLSGAGMGSDPDGASVYVRELADRIEALL